MQDKEVEISRALLSYLLKNPDAQDTLEGIVEWWLVAQMIESRTRVVERAIADLTSRQLLLENQGADQCKRYRINSSRIEEIKALLGKDKEPE